jgi:SSS family solute:Na+ symporter
MSLFATNLSSVALVGLAGGAYQAGIVVFNYEWMATVVLITFAALFLPAFYRDNLVTVPAQLGQRYDRRVGVMLSLVTIILGVFVEMSGALYAGARVLTVARPDISLAGAIAGLAGIAALIAFSGGLRLIVKAQVVQFALLLASSLIVALSAFQAAGGLPEAFSAVPAERLSLIRPVDDPTLPWIGLLLGVPVLGFYFWCSNQVMVQRVLAARDLHQARLGCLFAGLLKLTVLFLLVMPGVWTERLYPDLANADDAYAALVLRLLSPPLMLIVLLALLGAALSATAATLNAISTLVAFDFFKVMKPAASDAQLVRAGRITAAVATLLVVVWAPRIEEFPSLWSYMQAVLSYVTPPFVALFVVGWFYPAATARAGFLALMAGLALGATLLMLQASAVLQIHFLIAAFAIFATSGVVLVLLSKRAQHSARTFARNTMKEPVSGKFGHLAAALLAATAILVICFW